MYASGGKGVRRDYVASVKWLKLAAAQIANAQLFLGVSYYKGEGVPQDYVRAHMWSNLAASSGVSGASKFRDLIAQQMTPQKIAEAQTLARDCQARNFKGCD
jgi:hypothetical protein